MPCVWPFGSRCRHWSPSTCSSSPRRRSSWVSWCGRTIGGVRERGVFCRSWRSPARSPQRPSCRRCGRTNSSAWSGRCTRWRSTRRDGATIWRRRRAFIIHSGARAGSAARRCFPASSRSRSPRSRSAEATPSAIGGPEWRSRSASPAWPSRSGRRCQATWPSIRGCRRSQASAAPRGSGTWRSSRRRCSPASVSPRCARAGAPRGGCRSRRSP